MTSVNVSKVQYRTVLEVLKAQMTEEGEGFFVHRPFPAAGFSHFDPFLLLDEMGPIQIKPGEAKGAPNHPHRGFETVTYMLSGEMEHKDSNGNSGKLRPGDVQWMTAGRGVIHSELPSKEFQQTGGKMHGFQLWVNLPSVFKKIPAHYQEIPSLSIPEVLLDKGTIRVKVIAGEVGGVKANIETRTPIVYLDFELNPGAKLMQALPEGFNAFAYVYEGEGQFGVVQSKAKAHDMVILSQEGGELAVENKSDRTLKFLLIAGKPLNEPVARFGPFVMNTHQELEEAFWDYHSGNFT